MGRGQPHEGIVRSIFADQDQQYFPRPPRSASPSKIRRPPKVVKLQPPPSLPSAICFVHQAFLIWPLRQNSPKAFSNCELVIRFVDGLPLLSGIVYTTPRSPS